MLLIWIPVSVLAMYFVLNIVYGKLWKNGLQAELRFEERDVEEGDETILVETVTNDKFLPLPEAQMDRFLMKLSIGLPDEENECRIMARSPSFTLRRAWPFSREGPTSFRKTSPGWPFRSVRTGSCSPAT